MQCKMEQLVLAAIDQPIYKSDYLQINTLNHNCIYIKGTYLIENPSADKLNMKIWRPQHMVVFWHIMLQYCKPFLCM